MLCKETCGAFLLYKYRCRISLRETPLTSVQITPKIHQALQEKADQVGLKRELLEQVYYRGYMYANDTSLTKEQQAFNRVNSFINGGKALDLDYDLLECMCGGSDGEKKKSSMLSVIKKVLKKKE